MLAERRWGIMSRTERERRLARNHLLFREINERVRGLSESFDLVSDRQAFICECGDTRCTEQISMTLREYEHVRSKPGRFLVVKGHERSGVDTAVVETDRFLVVETRAELLAAARVDASFRSPAAGEAPAASTHAREGETMADIEGQLVKYIDEAYAMEQNVLRMLDGMIRTTDDPGVIDTLEHHKQETEQQAERLEQRLEAHGASPSTMKEAGGILGALMKGVVDMARGGKAGRNARDGFATEHFEIASYELLERVARRAGDEETADVARRNRSEEEAMAGRIAEKWDLFAELSLKEEGVPVP